jgi:N-acetyl sugar amidotransferase
MRILVLTTTSFPFGQSEPLLVDQIFRFSNYFDKIIIITCSTESKNTIFPLPQNTFTYYISNKLNIIEKIAGISNILSPIIKEERFYFKKTFKRKLGINEYKVLLNAFTLAKKQSRKIKSILNKETSADDQVFIHNYWCTEMVIAYSILKNKGYSFKLNTRIHAFDLYIERHKPNYLPLRKFIHTHVDNLFFISNQGKEYYENLYPFIKKEDLLKNKINRLGVSIKKKNDESTKFYKAHKLSVVSCSSIIALKRIHLIIDSLYLIENIAIEWTHFGTGELHEEVENYAKTKLNDKKNIIYTFLGFTENNEIQKFYLEKNIDLFINVSQYEGVPISMMEAMAYQIPCVGTNVGGVKEIINQSNGYLLEKNFEPIELKETIEKFASLSIEERTVLKSNAYQAYIKKYNAKTNFELLIKTIFPTYQQCEICLFDNEIYRSIKFDTSGVCSVCQANKMLFSKSILPKEIRENKLENLILTIKKEQTKYNCLIGLSGGVDSSYLIHLAYSWGLNPLILHVDNGWNSELASKNIEILIKKTGFDLYTYVINWEEMRDIQLSFLKASVVDIDMPMDNAILAMQFKIAKKFKIKHIINGINTLSEGWMPTEFSHYKLDSLNIKSIHKLFGKVKYKTFPTINPLQFYFYSKHIKFHSPLNLIDYNKEDAKKILMTNYDWKDYGDKHFENIYTKYYQKYILTDKFHFDKRISHLSVLICSGQLTKKEALLKLHSKEEINDNKEIETHFFAKKLGISDKELNEILLLPPKKHIDYPSYVRVINFLIDLKRRLVKSYDLFNRKN